LASHKLICEDHVYIVIIDKHSNLAASGFFIVISPSCDFPKYNILRFWECSRAMKALELSFTFLYNLKHPLDLWRFGGLWMKNNFAFAFVVFFCFHEPSYPNKKHLHWMLINMLKADVAPCLVELLCHALIYGFHLFLFHIFSLFKCRIELNFL